MNTINFSNVSVDIHDGPIGIMLSGGADSSILFYILAKYATGPIHVISCGNGNTNNHEPVNALRVINKCIELTGNRNVFFNAFWVDHKTPMSMISNNKVFADAGVSMLYNAFTKPPKEGIITNFDNDGRIAVGGTDPGIVLPNYWTQEHSSFISKVFKFDVELKRPFYTPFININKQEIAKLYEELNVLLELFPVTRSCESLTLTTGHCGTCWWCKERMWAFSKLE